MPKRTKKKLTKSLHDIGKIRVNDWPFPEFLNKELKDLGIRSSLRRLGRVQVTEWDFKDVLPAINKVAKTEIDIDGFVRRTANYKVMEWDFRDTLKASRKAKINTITETLTQYLEYVITQLIDEPKHLSIHAEEIAPRVIKFNAVMNQKDASSLIGMNGKTAGPLRRLLKASAELRGAHALLQIQSHQEAERN